MKVAYLGPQGTYTEEAARTLPAATAFFSCPNIEAVFTAVASGDAARGLVPFENVIEGPVTETLDCLFHSSDAVRVVDMVLLPIEHAIGALDADANITRVFSKDQALKQCSKFLQSLVPAVDTVETASTAAAIERIAENALSDAAAIASVRALEQHGFHIIARDIGNIKRNKTRFAVLAAAHEPFAPPTGQDTTSLVVYPHRDRIGLLHDILAVLSQNHGLSCSSIHSRPDTRGAFRFYLEIEGHLRDEPVQGFLRDVESALEGFEMEVRVFGTYPRTPFVERRLRRIGIIGGTGKMGGWLQQFFSQAGYEVLLAGRRTPLTYEACVQQADAVIINVPIEHTVAIIDRVASAMRPGQLLLDNTSIKMRPVEAMLRAAPAGVEVLGMHTIFGPGIASLRGQNVVFTRTRTSSELAWELENIFHKYGARVTYTTPQHHDLQMALHQNLEHFTKVVLAEVLRQHLEDPAELLAYASPNSRATLATLGRVLSSEPDLCAQIQLHNPQGSDTLRAYLQTANRIGEALIGGDTAPFTRAMQQARAALGEEFVADMQRRSRAAETPLLMR